MLVEDDNNLREIYEARLLAEGYEIVSAKDGEEALALAVKEKPDLIISDVMMPKISGFDMLDILRSTPETKDTKVIMMTALSQAEDKSRADKLGADRYLVKSQVTLEDVAKVAREVLQGKPSAQEPPQSPMPTNDPPAEPPAPSNTPVTASEPPAAAVSANPSATPTNDPPAVVDPPAAEDSATPAAPAAVSTDPNASAPDLAPTRAAEEAAVNAQIDDFVAKQQTTTPSENPKTPQTNTVEAPAEPQTPEAQTTNIEVKTAPAPDATNQAAHTAEQLTSAVNDLLSGESTDATKDKQQVTTPSTSSSGSDGDNASNHKRIIQPINDPTVKPDLNALLEKEDNQQGSTTPPASSVVSPGGPMVTPPNPGATPDPTAPGNVIQPGKDPNSIAL